MISKRIISASFLKQTIEKRKMILFSITKRIPDFTGQCLVCSSPFAFCFPSNPCCGNVFGLYRPQTRGCLVADPRNPPVARQVNAFPAHWNGKPGKAMHVVVKRKKIDTQAMYGVFKTKPDAPLCTKCLTPCNYMWRSRRLDQALRSLTNEGSSKSDHRRLPEASNRCEESVTSFGASIDEGSAAIVESGTPLSSVNLLCSKFRDRQRDLMRHARRICQGTDGGVGGSQHELWYENEFQHLLKIYLKPEVARPAPLQGGRYPIGSRIACFAGKRVWYPGTVEVVRQNNTYDIRYDNGDIARHVFPRMIRFEPVRRDSRLARFFYGLALGAAVFWPLRGFLHFSLDREDQGGQEGQGGQESPNQGALLPASALVLGLAGIVAVAGESWAIYKRNKRAGLCVVARYAAMVALPPASLALTGGLVTIKVSRPSSAGSWIEVSRKSARERKRERLSSHKSATPHEFCVMIGFLLLLSIAVPVPRIACQMHKHTARGT